MNHNMKLGLITAVSLILLFVLSLIISQTPGDADKCCQIRYIKRKINIV